MSLTFSPSGIPSSTNEKSKFVGFTGRSFALAQLTALERFDAFTICILKLAEKWAAMIGPTIVLADLPLFFKPSSLAFL